MKNEKVVKVCEVVIQICNIAVIIAQAVKSAFPSSSKQVASPEDVALIKEFLEQKEFVK